MRVPPAVQVAAWGRYPKRPTTKRRTWWARFALALLTDFLLILAGFYLATALQVDRDFNPHRWEGGDGPDTVCVYETIPDGRASKGGPSTWLETWTICDPGEEP